MRAVVGGILDDGVISETEVINQLEQFADLHVMLDHAVAILVLAGDATVFALTWVRKCMREAFHQQKKGFPPWPAA